MEGRDFVTDNYEIYNKLIPEIRFFQGKDLTFPIEQDNSNTRHYIGRFRRKSKITPRKMIHLFLLLLYRLQCRVICSHRYKRIRPTFLVRCFKI